VAPNTGRSATASAMFQCKKKGGETLGKRKRRWRRVLPAHTCDDDDVWWW